MKLHQLVLRTLLFIVYLPIMVFSFYFYLAGVSLFAGWLADHSFLSLILIGLSLGSAIIIIGAILLSRSASYLIALMKFKVLKVAAKWLTLIVCLYDTGRLAYNAWDMLDFTYTTQLITMIILLIGLVYIVMAVLANLFLMESKEGV